DSRRKTTPGLRICRPATPSSGGVLFASLPAGLTSGPSGSPASAAPARSPSAEAAGGEASAAFHFRTSFVHVEGASLKILAVQRLNRLLPFIRPHVDEPKPAWFAGVAVGHDLDALHLSKRFKQRAHVCIGSTER